jgi:hypothetical protein
MFKDYFGAGLSRLALFYVKESKMLFLLGAREEG